jgi:hypothetical protein
MKTLLIVFAAALLMSGCSITHDIAKDYPQYLINNQGAFQLQSTTAASQYVIAPATASNRYEFHSAMAGYANVWVVRFGQILDDTLQSHDVQTAFGKLAKSSGTSADDGLLVFDLQSYSYAEFGAQVSVKVTYRRGNQEVFSKVYEGYGITLRGKMFRGSDFAMKDEVQAMKEEVQESTKLAVDTILGQLIADLDQVQRDGSRPLLLQQGQALAAEKGTPPFDDPSSQLNAIVSPIGTGRAVHLSTLSKKLGLKEKPSIARTYKYGANLSSTSFLFQHFPDKSPFESLVVEVKDQTKTVDRVDLTLKAAACLDPAAVTQAYDLEYTPSMHGPGMAKAYSRTSPHGAMEITVFNVGHKVDGPDGRCVDEFFVGYDFPSA